MSNTVNKVLEELVLSGELPFPNGEPTVHSPLQ